MSAGLWGRSTIRTLVCRGLTLVTTTALLLACTAPDNAPARDASASDARVNSTSGGAIARAATPAAWPAVYGLGVPASPAAVQLLDTDVDTTGAGLPDGHGTAAEGAVVYAAKCAVCHGVRGEGVPPSPAVVLPLVATDKFPWATKPGTPKTVGNYWPFATTLYAYILHAMPLPAPGSLSSTEVYQLVAYLLAENGVMSRDVVVDARSLPTIKLPGRGRLTIDTRRGGAEVR